MYRPPASSSKRVLVAGGGPGGMTAAIIAAERGHRVTLCEVSGRLGGQLLFEEHIPFKQSLYDYIRVSALRMERLGVEVHLDTPATPELAAKLMPDVIIAAVGADYIVPDITGIHSETVRFLPSLGDLEKNFGKRVVVLGGGQVGCETAIHLSKTGRNVTIIEMKDEYAPDAALFHRLAIRLQIAAEGVRVELNMKAVAIREKALICGDAAGNERIFEADTFFCAVGMRSRAEAVEALRFCAPQFFTVGDCVRPGQVTQTISDGHYAALDI